MMEKSNQKRVIYFVLPLLGAALCLWYVKNATCDVVYSDYIRLVNSYLPDVFDPKKFFVPDVLTRIPITYLGRIVNVTFFGYSLTFDRVLGVMSLLLAAWILAVWCARERVGLWCFALCMVVMFSLNKWEMLINGSGWCHFFAFACFYYHQTVLDRIWRGEAKKGDRIRLAVLPWVITLGIAGPYCAVYSGALILAYGFCMICKKRKNGVWEKEYLIWIVCTVIPLICYMISNAFVEEGYTGVQGERLSVVITKDPTFLIRFVLKSLASIVVGREEFEKLVEANSSVNTVIYLIGALVALSYLAAFAANFYYRLYERTIFPLILIVSGAMNHVLIMLSRYAFWQDNYGMSSRYALQFQVGILGILLTIGLLAKRLRSGGRFRRLAQGFSLVFCLAILAGNAYTIQCEIQKAPYREEYFEQMAVRVAQIDQMSDEELANCFEYYKGSDKIARAFEILRENHLNVFR